MSTKVEPGDINIHKIELKKDNRAIDIRGQILSFSIFEDIQEPTVLAEFTLIDAVNLVQDFPIVGEETINIVYTTPGRQDLIRRGFLIYSIESTAMSPTTKSSLYLIKAVSPIHFVNSITEINKTYKDSIDNIVKDILETTIRQSQTSKINYNIEPTKGIVPINVPGLAPFEAIDFLRQKAISKQFASGGSYVFFENVYGLNFVSLEKLLKEGKDSVGSRVFSYGPNTSSSNERTSYAFRNLIDYTHITKFDSVEKINSGTFRSYVNSFDIITKKNTVYEYSLAENAKSFTSSDNKGSLTNTESFIQKYGKASLKSFLTVKDSSKGDDYIDINVGAKNAFSYLLNQNILRAYVYGDSFLTVGDTVTINLPEPSSTTERRSNLALYSGNYLITALRHLIVLEGEAKPKHKISFDCVKMGYKA